MSESDTSTISETSESTLGTFQFDKVLESLQSAANDVIETKDFLSYSTLLDIYLSEPTKYSNEEKEELLGHILNILGEHKELTYEIGWDLPSLLILYIESSYDFSGSIRSAPCVYKILKIFECLALNGNPKELFLKSCELLTNIKISDVKTTDDESAKEKFFDIKLYCIFELIDSCLKRINTYYPSRFLSMTVTSFINLVYVNCTENSNENSFFIMKRAYSFARNYISPSLPDEIDPTLSKEDLSKIKDDEEYLQRKLLTGFITQVVNLVGIRHISGYSLDHFSYLQKPNRDKSNKYFEYQVQIPVMDRLAELVLSFDINLAKVFKQFITDAHIIFHSFNYSKANQDDLNGDIFEKLIIDYQKNLANSIIDSDAKNINDSILGCLILYTHQISPKRTFDRIDVTFNDALVFTLRLLIPSMIQSSFISRSSQDIAIFWSWYSIHQSVLNNKKIEMEISIIPKILLTIYYQVILFVCISNSDLQSLRYIALTLLTKVLALSPEGIAYSFIRDSLINCPFDNIKATLIGVLKELLTKEKQDTDRLAEELSAVKIDNSKVEDEKQPSLPPRDNINCTCSKYFTLNKEKANDIFELIDSTIDSAFIESEPETKENDIGKIININQSKFAILSAYLNLLVVIKDDPIIIENRHQLNSIIDKVKENVSIIKLNKKQNESNSFELNAAGILNVTLERINL